jgi:hypothetical protein
MIQFNREDVSHIIVHTQFVEWSKATICKYEWQDATKRLAIIQGDVEEEIGEKLNIGKIFSLGSLRLQAIDYDIMSDTWIVQRITKLSWLWYLKYRTTKILYGFGSRLLWTAVIWGLADRPTSSYPISYRDLKIIKRWHKFRS